MLGSNANFLLLDSYLGSQLYSSGCRMANQFHLDYARRVAKLINRDPKKWIPIWKHHMTQYLM
jgi:hypothetical protein